MAGRSRPSFQKRQREQALVDQRKEKERRRDDKRNRPESNASGGGDPDLEGIVPGPQPRPEWMGEDPPAAPSAPSTDGE